MLPTFLLLLLFASFTKSISAFVRLQLALVLAPNQKGGRKEEGEGEEYDLLLASEEVKKNLEKVDEIIDKALEKLDEFVATVEVREDEPVEMVYAEEEEEEEEEE